MSREDRMKSAMRGINEELAPRQRFFGTYGYVVASCDGKTCEAKVEDSTLGLPAMTKIKLRPSILCETSKLSEGCTILVIFRNGDPALPECVGADSDSIPEESHVDAKTLLELGKTVTQAKLGEGASMVAIAGGVLGVARMTDPVIAGPFAGTITMGSTKVTSG